MDKITLKDGKIIEGTIIQEDKTVFIKMDNGYNVGIDKKNIKSIKKSNKTKEKTKIPKAKEYKNLKNIFILHCGGTIASRVDYKTGGVSSSITTDEFLKYFPQLEGLANFKLKLLGNWMSENISFKEHNLIINEIKNILEKEKPDGILITHGTDTMHYTSAALKFAIDGLTTPIIMVGSQRSSDRPSSDSLMNFKCAIEIINNSDFGDIGVCMHTSSNDEGCSLLNAFDVRKMHTSKRDAFKSINSPPYMEVNDKIQVLNKSYKKRKKQSKIKVTTFNEKLKIGFIVSHPNLSAEEITNYEKFNALIIQGTGLGHIPIDNPKIESALKKLKIPIIITPQTIYGRIDMDVYSAGRKLKQLGVYGDKLLMTPETIFIKTAWLLSNKCKMDDLYKDFKGEIVERSL